MFGQKEETAHINVDLALENEIVPEATSIKFLANKIEIKLKKAEGIQWKKLEANKSQPPAFQAVTVAAVPAQPEFKRKLNIKNSASNNKIKYKLISYIVFFIQPIIRHQVKSQRTGTNLWPTSQPRRRTRSLRATLLLTSKTFFFFDFNFIF